MTTVIKPLPEDLQTLRQVLLDDLVKILEQRQPVMIRRWLKPNETMLMLGISRHKLLQLREAGTLVYKKMGEHFFYDYESVMKYRLPDESAVPAAAPPPEDPVMTVSPVHDAQLYAGQEPEGGNTPTAAQA